MISVPRAGVWLLAVAGGGAVGFVVVLSELKDELEDWVVLVVLLVA